MIALRADCVSAVVSLPFCVLGPEEVNVTVHRFLKLKHSFKVLNDDDFFVSENSTTYHTYLL